MRGKSCKNTVLAPNEMTVNLPILPITALSRTTRCQMNGLSRKLVNTTVFLITIYCNLYAFYLAKGKKNQICLMYLTCVFFWISKILNICRAQYFLKMKSSKISSRTINVYLLVLTPAYDTIHSVECARSHKQDVGCVDRNTVAAQFTRVSFRNIDYRALQKLQHTLQTNLHICCL